LADARRSRLEGAAGIGIAALFAWYRLDQGLHGVALVWQDTFGYQESAFWAGIRPPVAPALWWLTGSPRVYVVAQTVVAVLAWCFLAWTVALAVGRAWWRVLAGTVVLAFASTMPIVLWDRSVLSESVSFSALALVFATAIWVARRVTWPRVVALVAASAALALARDSLIWMVLGLALVVIVFAVVRASGRKVIVLGIALLGVSCVALVGQAQANRNLDNIEHVYFVRIFPFADRVEWFADHGMPDAGQVLKYAKATRAAPGEAKVVTVAPNDPTAQALVRWLRSGDATRTYLEYVALHPWYVLTEPLRDPERTFNNAQGNLAFYAAPDRTDLTVLDAVFDPGPLVVVLALVAAVGVAWVRGVWRERWWQMVALLGALGAFEILVAWHGDGTETTRHGIVGSVTVRLAVVVLLTAAALAPRSRVRAAFTRGPGQGSATPGYAPAVASEPGRV
jgi:hypothetical protein